MNNIYQILKLIQNSAEKHADLSMALEQSSIHGSNDIAHKLKNGASINEAMADVLPIHLCEHLSGSDIPLAISASLLADESWRQHKRRIMVLHYLLYPVCSLLMVLALAYLVQALVPVNNFYGSLVSYSYAAIPAFAALFIGIAPWTPAAWCIPGSGWSRHLDKAAKWARAGMAVHYRLTEAQAEHMLHVDLKPMTISLSTPHAEQHCQMLAKWHQRAAEYRLFLTAMLASACILLSAGGLVLAATRLWMGNIP